MVKQNKKSVKTKYYAIRVGHKPGIYTSWAEASIQVDGLTGCEYKSFKSLAQAEEYMNEKSETYKHTQKSGKGTSTSSKYYAVRIGARPGVYVTYEEAKEQISGYSGGKYKSFKSLDQARLYVLGWDKPQDWSKLLDNKEIIISNDDLDTLESYYDRLVNSKEGVDTTQYTFGINDILAEYNEPENIVDLNTSKVSVIQSSKVNLFTLTDEDRADYMLKGDTEAQEVIDFYNHKDEVRDDEYTISVSIQKNRDLLHAKQEESVKKGTTINNRPMYKSRIKEGREVKKETIYDKMRKGS